MRSRLNITLSRASSQIKNPPAGTGRVLEWFAGYARTTLAA